MLPGICHFLADVMLALLLSLSHKVTGFSLGEGCGYSNLPCSVDYVIDHGDILLFVRKTMILDFSSFSSSPVTLSFLETAALMPNIVSSQGQDFWAAVCYTNQVFALSCGVAAILDEDFKYANNKFMLLHVTFPFHAQQEFECNTSHMINLSL